MTIERTTAYFPGEGRRFIDECIERSLGWASASNVGTLVIFTGTGEGPHKAASRVVASGSSLRVVAVTPPFGRPYKQNPTEPSSPIVRSGVNAAMRSELNALGVEVVSAHLPFKEMFTGSGRSSEWSRVAEAYGVLGGGFALCIQAVLVACDAGFVLHGDRVIAMGADTSIVVTACRTESFLSPTEGLLLEHIICRPSRFEISKPRHETVVPAEAPPAAPMLALASAPEEPAALPAPGTTQRVVEVSAAARGVPNEAVAERSRRKQTKKPQKKRADGRRRGG